MFGALNKSLVKISNKMHSAQYMLVSFFLSVIAIVMETRNKKVMSLCSLSLQFHWGKGEWVNKRQKIQLRIKKRRLFLFPLHDILHFFIIIINVRSYNSLFRSDIVSFPNIVSFNHHYYLHWEV